MAAQLGHQPGGGLGKTADRGDRRQLGGSEEDAHRPIMLARSNLRAMRSRRALAVSTLAATAVAGAALGSPAFAGDSDGDGDDRDKNVLLAEAQFQLFLVTADFVPSDITCTRPPLRDETGELLCYALISDRVSVAAIATMETPGVYAFLPLNKVDPADFGTEPPAGGEVSPEPPPATEVPEPTTAPGSLDPQTAADQAILASIDTAVADAQGLSRVLTENNSSITSVDLVAFDEPTSTVQVAVTTNAADPGTRDDVAFYVTDVMAYLWVESEPTRDADATIRPRLEVTVDGVIYGTPFDVMVEVADYTITQDEWLEIVTGNAAFQTAIKRGPKTDAKRSTTSSLSAAAPPDQSGASLAPCTGCLDSRAMNIGGLRRIAVVNRGEPAMRLIHAVRELRLVDRRRPCRHRPAHHRRARRDVRPRRR